MNLILQAIKALFRKVENGLSSLSKKVDTAQSTADGAAEKAVTAQTMANDAQTTADNAQSVANNAQTTADNAQSVANNAQTSADNANTTASNALNSMNLPYTVTWTRSSGAGYTQTIKINGRTFVRKYFQTSFDLVYGLHGGVYAFKKVIGDSSWHQSTNYIQEKNYWVSEDSSGKHFGVVYNEDGEPIIIATKATGTTVKGTIVSTAGLYVYEGEDYSIEGVSFYANWGASTSLLYKFQKLCGSHSVEGNPYIVKSSTEGSTKRFKITVDDSGTLSAVEVV